MSVALLEAIDRVIGLVTLAITVPMVGGVLWFYPHCVRPSLAVAGARRVAFVVGFGACVILSAALLGGAIATVEALRGEGPSGYVWYVPDLVVMFASLVVAAVGWGRPAWVVRLTGGPDATIPKRYLLDWLSGRWMSARGDEQRERVAATSFLDALSGWGLETSPDDAIADFVRGFDHHKSQRQGHRRVVAAELRTIEPFDPVSWFRVVRYRRTLGS